MIKVVAVVRVSDPRQATSGYGPDAQRADMLQFAERNGLAIVETIEDRISGTVPVRRRPGGQKLYGYIDGTGGARRIDGVLFPRVDRLARDEDGIEVLQLRRDIRERGLRLFWADRGEADLSGFGGMIDFIQAVAAGEERLKIIRRTNDGKLAQVRAGQTMAGGRTPYGYKKVSTPRSAHQRRTERFEIDAAEARIVRRIFALCLEGVSVGGIARQLSDTGVPTRSHTHSGYPATKYSSWGRATIAGILKNRAYVGEWIYNKVRVIRPKIRGEGKHQFVKRPPSEHIVVEIPAIIDRPTFDAAQRQLEQNRHLTRPPKHTYLMRGRLRCAKCGRYIVGRSHRRGNSYICGGNNTSLPGDRRCRSPHFSTIVVDHAAWEFVSHILLEPGLILKYRGAAAQPDRTSEIAEIDAAIERERTARRNWERMLANDRTSEPSFDEEVGAIDGRIATLMASRATIEREAGAASSSRCPRPSGRRSIRTIRR